MAIVPQTGSLHCIQTDTMWSKSGQNVVFNVANNMDIFKKKETLIGFCSLSCNLAKKTNILHRNSAGVGRKQGQKVIVAASPPIEDAVVAAEPLTKEDLVGYLASGCKPKENWR